MPTAYDVWMEILEKNRAKLKARYKGKFTETRAEERDLPAERQILELDRAELEALDNK